MKALVNIERKKPLIHVQRVLINITQAAVSSIAIFLGVLPNKQVVQVNGL